MRPCWCICRHKRYRCYSIQIDNDGETFYETWCFRVPRSYKNGQALARCSVVLILMIIAQRRVKTIGHRHPTSYLDLYRQLTNELLKDILQSPRICFYLFFNGVVNSTITLKKLLNWKYFFYINKKQNTLCRYSPKMCYQT